MTRLTAPGNRAALGAPARARPVKNRKPALAAVFADPRIRLGAAAAVMLITAVAARQEQVSPCEARTFRAVNDLPGSLYPAAWLVMQLGTLGAAPTAAGAAWLAGDGELAARLLVNGTGTWVLAKLVKRLVHRSRPAGLLPGTRCHGRPATGLGYLSGHAGVATALSAAALPRLGPAGRALALLAIPAVGLTRIYAGAHLPLDIAGGVALGLTVEAAAAIAGVSERFHTGDRTGPRSHREGPRAPGWRERDLGRVTRLLAPAPAGEFRVDRPSP
jgi:membrane-associated phospholipid phosphatase